MSNYFKNVIVDLSGEHTESARVTIVGGKPDVVFRLFEEPLKTWNEFGILGAFCTPTGNPSHATINVEPVEAQKAGTQEWKIHLQNCDPRCLIVLANMLLGAVYQRLTTLDGQIPPPEDGTFCKGIHIYSTNIENGSQRYDYNIPDFRFKGTFLPDVSKQLEFDWQFEEITMTKAYRRVILEFSDSNALSQLESIEEIARLWSQVVRDGYPQSIGDLYTGECTIEGIGVDIFDESSLEIKVKEFGGSESAWNSLLNALGGSRSAIKRVRVF